LVDNGVNPRGNQQTDRQNIPEGNVSGAHGRRRLQQHIIYTV